MQYQRTYTSYTSYDPPLSLLGVQAVEQYEAVKEREREQVAELEEARSTAKAATSWFHGLKEERCSLFMAAFQHVADIIDTVYTVCLLTAAFSKHWHHWHHWQPQAATVYLLTTSCPNLLTLTPNHAISFCRLPDHAMTEMSMVALLSSQEAGGHNK